MTEIFSALLGKKKKSPRPPQNGASTYSISESTNQDQFVIVERPENPAVLSNSLYPNNKKVESDYEHLYSFLDPQTLPYPVNPIMGAYPSRPVQPGENNEHAAPVINVQPAWLAPTRPAPPPPQFGQTYTVPQVTTQDSQEGSFLTGVPFTVESAYSDSLFCMKVDLGECYNFLDMKASVLSALDYDFQLERQVLQESVSLESSSANANSN